ncbi:hypothetical protein U2P60_06275 [Brucella sp. H1_1004]|uniref:hypothetical protein n=1 Tax=Brucella sp. H1_1004 TaxID=3110109 RepID=UPI0039B67A23
MVKVYLEEVGKAVFVGMTPELSDDLVAHRQAVCSDHPETDLVRLPTSNGGEQIRRQCRKCGHLLGGAKKRELGHENLPLPNFELKSGYEAQRDREYNRIFQKHAKLQFEKSNSWFRDYSAYLESDEWREKRQLVFKRSGGMCEGCGSATATQVHHLTYEHAKAEFLFELVAVCDACHDRLHDDAPNDQEDADEDQC